MTTNDDELRAIQRMIRFENKTIRTSELARVVSYDHEKQLVTVQPVMQLVDTNGKYARQGEAKKIPVKFPDFGDWAIISDLTVGHVGEIVYAERDIETWLKTGKADIKPADSRRFDPNDCWFEPGLRHSDDKHGANVARAGELVLSKKDGSVQIRLKDGEVIIDADTVLLGGPGASSFLALADKVDKFITLVDTVLTTWTVVPSDGGAALKAFWSATKLTAYATTGGLIGSVGASKVKGE